MPRREVQAAIVRAGFAEWYETSYPKVFTAVCLSAGDRELASDACAEAYLRAFADWVRVSKMASPDGWAYTVAINEVKRERRRGARRGRPLRPEELQAPAAPLLDPVVVEAISSLSTRQRTVLLGRALLDIPPAELASLLGVREGTVWATYNAARTKTAERIQAARDKAGE